jgi:small conductance mechanosensitive channel
MSDFFNDFFGVAGKWLSEHFWSSLLTVIVGYLVYRLGAKLVSVLVKFLVKTTKKHTWPKKDIEKRQKTLVTLASATWKFLVIVVIITTLVESIFPQANLSAIIAGLGVIGVAVGFGAQSLVKDFLSGIFIISENQYRVGDVVDLDGSIGKIEHVGTRSTILRDNDGSVHFIPNGSISHVVNKTMEYGDSRLEVKVDYENDLDQVMTIINQVGETVASDARWNGKILEPPHFSEVSGLDGRTVTLTITGKTLPSDQWGVISDMRLALVEEFKKSKIKLATTATSKVKT